MLGRSLECVILLVTIFRLKVREREREGGREGGWEGGREGGRDGGRRESTLYNTCTCMFFIYKSSRNANMHILCARVMHCQVLFIVELVGVCVCVCPSVCLSVQGFSPHS